jgi:hypothetical protein
MHPLAAFVQLVCAAFLVLYIVFFAAMVWSTRNEEDPW